MNCCSWLAVVEPDNVYFFTTTFWRSEINQVRRSSLRSRDYAYAELHLWNERLSLAKLTEWVVSICHIISLRMNAAIRGLGHSHLWNEIFFNTIFVSSHMCPENPEGTQVIVGSMNMGYISYTARNRTHNLFRPKREPITLGHSDGRNWNANLLSSANLWWEMFSLNRKVPARGHSDQTPRQSPSTIWCGPCKENTNIYKVCGKQMHKFHRCDINQKIPACRMPQSLHLHSDNMPHWSHVFQIFLGVNTGSTGIGSQSSNTL